MKKILSVFLLAALAVVMAASAQALVKRWTINNETGETLEGIYYLEGNKGMPSKRSEFEKEWKTFTVGQVEDGDYVNSFPNFKSSYFLPETVSIMAGVEGGAEVGEHWTKGYRIWSGISLHEGVEITLHANGRFSYE
jgi:hypothetical protein